MMTNLQVPMDKKIRDESKRVATELGFSTLQDAVRMFLAQLAERKITVSILPREERLTKKQETTLLKKYNMALKEIKEGKAFMSDNPTDLISHLNSS